MRAVVQRVSSAAVEVEGREVGSIGRGLLVLLGVGRDDTRADLDWLAGKIVCLRIFPDPEGQMNLSLAEVGGSLLVVSQFTLYGDCRKGRRPSFVDAAGPQSAEALYREFVEKARERGAPVVTGRFGADMQVRLVNDGPVTLLLDTAKTS